MLPQIGMTEMLLLGVLALAVLGPRDLSLMMRRIGRWTGKLRAMAWEFRQSFDEIGRQAELDELRKEVEALKTNSGLDEVQRDISKAESDIKAAVKSSPATKSEASSEDEGEDVPKSKERASKDAAE